MAVYNCKCFTSSQACVLVFKTSLHVCSLHKMIPTTGQTTIVYWCRKGSVLNVPNIWSALICALVMKCSGKLLISLTFPATGWYSIDPNFGLQEISNFCYPTHQISWYLQFQVHGTNIWYFPYQHLTFQYIAAQRWPVWAHTNMSCVGMGNIMCQW